MRPMITFVITIITFLSNLPDCLSNNLTGQLSISTAINLVGVSSINLMESAFQVDLFIIYRWTLNLEQCKTFYLEPIDSLTNQTFFINGLNGAKLITDSVVLDRVWLPVTYLRETKSLITESQIKPSRVLQIKSRAAICQFKYTTRLSTLIGCKMDYREYPNDIQLCPISLTSFFWPDQLIKYEWFEPAITYQPKDLDQNHYEVSLRTSESVEPGFDEEYRTWLVLQFTFKRKLTHFVYSVVIPSILIVASAYFSFWISVDSGPGRFMFTALPFFSLITLYSGLKAELPPVSYVNACDIWILGTLSFEFVTICVMTGCVYLTRQDKLIGKQKPHSIDSESRPEQSHPHHLGSWRVRLKSISLRSCRNRHHSRADRLDYIMKIVFPISFIVFNIVFWILVHGSQVLTTRGQVKSANNE